MGEPPPSLTVHIVSTSNASDCGYRALADLADAAADLDYRVVGGHMVQLLVHAYPTANPQIRGTIDADIGVDHLVAAGGQLHQRLVDLDYEPEVGNRYTRNGPEGQFVIDVLVPWGVPGTPEVIGGRGFDPIPGLGLAMSAAPTRLSVEVTLRSGSTLTFSVLIPNIEPAVVLKALAWQHRSSDKDLVDLASLFEIVHAHRDDLIGWRLDDLTATATGARKDVVQALRALLTLIERGRFTSDQFGGRPPAHVAALIRRYTSL